jgi:hypothetical protein
MQLRQVPKVIFSGELPGSPGEGIAVAVMPSGREVAVQIALRTERLAGFSAERPPSVLLGADAALALALALLAELAPDLSRALDAHDRRALRLVGGGEPGSDAPGARRT